MNPQHSLTRGCLANVVAMFCGVLIGSGDLLAVTAGSPRLSVPQASSSQDSVPPIPPDQLDSLVAPIALYPDPLLAQTLAASTYPLELMQLHQWLSKNSGLKDKALADAAARQPWDASVQAMAGVPDVVKRLTDDIQWTTDLGNAFLAQQSDVMNAVQRMRRKAEDKGNLKSTQQQVVETKAVEGKQVIVIEQASPQVVYVPSYDPVAVYGPPLYPYPPISYPPPGAYAAGMAVSFGVGVAVGAFSSGGWGWNAGWGHNDLTINNNNNFNRNANNNLNRTGNVRSNVGSGNTWQHRPEHRGGAPYRDRATAGKYGGTARGDSLANRQSQARQQIGRQGGQVGTSGVANRAGGGSAGIGARGGTGAGSRSGGSGGIGSRPGGADHVGQRDLSRGGGRPGAFGDGGPRGFDGAGARASSHRGSSSMGSRGGGGGRAHGGGGGRRR
jgi:hypothetical protein